MASTAGSNRSGGRPRDEEIDRAAATSSPLPPYAYCPVTDKLKDACGVFAVYGHPEAAKLTALGLHALQHRGQEAVGIVSFDKGRFHAERRVGLVGDNFDDPAVMARLEGSLAAGHVRYSTTGDSVLRNAQPLFADLGETGVAVGHNGNLTNARTLREELARNGAIFQSTSDTEVFLHLIALSRKRKFVERLIESLLQIEGAYAFAGVTNDLLFGARDPVGIRPLVLGRLGEAWVLTSETCALDIVGAQFVRDIENGEVVVIGRDGLSSHRAFPKHPARPCIFEYIYFARPDSISNGLSVYDARQGMGRELARESPAEVDVVVPIPDSGVPAAIGYAREAGLPFELGIIRNHYVGRTFIEPEQSIRDLGVRLKHAPNRSVIAGKRVILIDDSVVRGTTSQKIVRMMRQAGAREVHMRIASPPIRFPDFYGIDTPRKTDLLAARNSVEEMREFMGADSLAFLSIDGIYRAMGFAGRDSGQPQFTDHCFTGDYPTRLRDQEEPGDQRQLSLLSEAL
jgi:amidophosphoribosyltransferase